MGKLWDIRGPEEPLIRLLKMKGMAGAAEAMKLSVEDFSRRVVALRYWLDFEYFAKERLWITNKDGLIIPLILNSPQRKLLEVVERQRLQGKPVRVRMLKARQWGGTTEIQGIFFRDLLFRGGRAGMVVAHSIESANHIRGMSELYYNRYDRPKAEMKKSTDKAWKLRRMVEKKLVDSTFRIETAENLGAGHSMTTQILHCSEIQSWAHPDKLMRGLYPTVPETPETMIFEEGTGSGVGDFWYDSCESARNNEGAFEFVFVAWFELDDTVRPFEDGAAKAAFERDLNAEDRLLNESGVSLEHLHWKQQQLLNKYKNDPDGFKQQYPANPDEAFLTSGRPVFKPDVVQRKLKEAIPPLKIGNLVVKNGEVRLDEDENGDWSFWEEPERGVYNLYCIGADPVEGRAIIKELGNRGGDKAAARVFRRDTRKFVATFNARRDPDLFAEELFKASRYLFNCPLLPEQNAGGGGQLLIARLKDMRANLIKTPALGGIHDDTKEEYGWETNRTTKRLAIDNLIEASRAGEYTDPDKEVWYQMSTYVRDDKGGTDAQARKFDDLVMATAITLQADAMLPMYWKHEEDKKRTYTRDMDVPENRKKRHLRSEVMEINLVEF